jgi:hypothetical protein
VLAFADLSYQDTCSAINYISLVYYRVAACRTSRSERVQTALLTGCDPHYGLHPSCCQMHADNLHNIAGRMVRSTNMQEQMFPHRDGTERKATRLFQGGWHDDHMKPKTSLRSSASAVMAATSAVSVSVNCFVTSVLVMATLVVLLRCSAVPIMFLQRVSWYNSG